MSAHGAAAVIHASARTPSRKQLAARTFLLAGQRGAPELEGAPLRVSFRATDLTFSAGCNWQFGDYQISDGSIVAAGFGSTEMGCSDVRGASAQEAYFSSFMRSGPAVELDGTTLTLARGEVSVRFLDRVEADPDRPLIGTRWKLNSFTGHGTTSSWHVAVTPILTFTEDHSFVAKSGCLAVEGRYKVSGRKLLLSSTQHKLAECRDEGDIAIASFIDRLFSNGPTAYEVEAAHLRLRRSGLAIGAFAE